MVKTLYSILHRSLDLTQICIAMTIKTNFLLADELTNGLDFESIILLENLLEKEGEKRKIILISHAINFISKFPDDIRILENGNLYPYQGDLSLLEDNLISKGDLSDKIKSIKQYHINN